MNIHEIIWRYIKVVSTQLIIVAFAGVFVYKFAGLALGMKTEGLTTTDLLAILLAFFSMALAVIFYFKSTEESNRFYANSYEFTKAMSEMLGRIEAGFGERLRHIDEGYTHISQKFDDVVADRDKTVKKVEKKVEKEKEDVGKIEHERQRIIQSLVEKTGLQEVEKRQALEALSKKDHELQNAHVQLARYQHMLNSLEHKELHAHESELSDTLQRLLLTLAARVDDIDLGQAPSSLIRERLNPIVRNLDYPDRRMLQRYGVIDQNLEIRSRGIFLIRRFFEQRRGK